MLRLGVALAAAKRPDGGSQWASRWRQSWPGGVLGLLGVAQNLEKRKINREAVEDEVHREDKGEAWVVLGSESKKDALKIWEWVEDLEVSAMLRGVDQGEGIHVVGHERRGLLYLSSLIPII